MIRASIPLLGFLLVAGAGTARAQDCASPQPRRAGVSLGWSSPYVELDAGAPEPGATIPTSVQSGLQVAGRVDLPVAGPIRVRVEGALARWGLRERRYDAGGGFDSITDRAAGHVRAGHLVALVGVRTGRAPVCAHVSAGGGFHSLAFPDSSIRGLGAAVSAGVEIPTGTNGFVLLDATIHIIRTRERPPIDMSAVPALSLLAGWAYRF